MAQSSSLRRDAGVSGRAETTPSHERPVDLVHLSHQTMGDAALEREVLGLLARQIATFSERLEAAAPAERLRAAHALKGAALNVGAFRLARTAEGLERAPASLEAVGPFEREMAVTAGFIADLLQGHVASR